MKITKSQKGITLIALIITIVILLILAVVTIKVVQEDGIIEKAKYARDEYERAQAKENSILQGYLELLNDNTLYGSGGTGNTENENIGNENTEDKSDEEVYVNDYGAPIEYSVDLNDDGNLTNDWKVFYKDDTHWYIIASDYLKNTKLPDKFVGRMKIFNSYGACWNWGEPLFSNVIDGNAVISKEVANKYKLSWLENNSASLENDNIKAVADLLDEEAWTAKFGNTEKGIEAIGGPTLEMWVASWNEKGAELGTDKYVELKTEYNSIGDFIGPSIAESLSGIADNWDDTLGGYSYNIGTSMKGYGDKLYFPRNFHSDYCNGYWLTSPSASYSDSLMCVNYGGGVGYTNYGNDLIAVRPLVSVPMELIEDTADGFRVVE